MSKPWLIVGLVAIYPILMLVNVNVDEVIFADIACLLYTSDAADEMKCVDHGGRRIIK